MGLLRKSQKMCFKIIIFYLNYNSTISQYFANKVICKLNKTKPKVIRYYQA